MSAPQTDRLIPPTLLLAAAALVLGVYLPVVEVRNLAIFSTRFSIAEAAWQLLADRQYLLGAVIVVFSVVFPLGKILAAAALYVRLLRRGTPPDRWVGWLEFFGRWSSADVLLVAIAIVVAKSSGVADARMEIGLWFFAASIVLTGFGVHRLKRASAAVPQPQPSAIDPRDPVS
ncbi:MAG: paraquat-inducible protein A [Rhodospirillaceae bacterium]